MEGTDKLYAPKEIILLLDIADSTLRKWSIALEEQGYYFARTVKQRRMFSDRDVVVLKSLRNLVQVQNLSLQNASIIVASKYKDEPSAQENGENSVPVNRYDSSQIDTLIKEINSLKEGQEQLKAFNNELLQTLKQQQKYIDERLNKRDDMLLESIREVQKSNTLLLEQKKDKKRKGLFSFFSNE
ncbi:DUF3967 domain-containing protein [Cytobacillus gottheilii]|uniref:HTH merR-type domain-containing protein n=1 Tax=Cytobacillus gottheilii TaxID=859144 RepID=A0ABX8FIR9_9BACI|nr:DUF3967 domain-containing protein [Cytobacillus gottheilii]QVY63924.1 hypothetical protein J1899_22385 [Cytobacillus gottheilii]